MFHTDSMDAVFDRMLALSRALDHTLTPEQTRGANYGGARQQLWLPVVDVYETDNAFVIDADLPGVHPENVEISFEQGALTLKGTRAPALKTPEQGELRVFIAERITGGFARTVRLPEYVDGEKIEARYANGVLTVTVPKAPAALPRKIAIKAAESDSRRLNA
jgi:HSP20 family protein